MSILNVLRGLKKIQASLSSLKLGTDVLDNGDSIEFDGENILSGNQVFLKSASGDYSILPDGSYLTKSNITFTVKDALVDSVNTSAEAPKPASDTTEPVKQAQSKNEEVVKSDDSQDYSPEAPEPDAADDTEDADDDAAADAKQINDAITTALAPVWEAIKQLTQTMQMSATKTDEVNTNLSKVTETVNKIAKMPATEPTEGAVNAFAKRETPKTTKELAALKYFKPLDN